MGSVGWMLKVVKVAGSGDSICLIGFPLCQGN
jgi:hypothetical protein